MRRKHWLLVEDNAAEVELARDVLAERQDLDLSVARNGAEALGLLRADTSDGPSLVLLDLNLPGLSGMDILKQLRAETRLRHIPVVVLSSSDRAQDIAAAYGAGANAYLIKPIHHAQFAVMLRETTRYWLSMATLPQHS